MMIRSSGTATLKDIERFEQQHGIRLPQSYRSFLVEHNGGEPSPSLFVSPRNAKFTANVALIFAIGKAAIDEEIDAFPGCLERGLLPIAISGGGDVYFLCLNSGNVHFWNHEIHPLAGFLPSELPWLAESIAELLANLKGDNESFSEVEDIAQSGSLTRFDMFLQNNPIDARSKEGRTLVQEAARYGQLKLLKRCIASGASTEGLMHWAARQTNLEIIDFLLSIGLNINEVDENGKTPLGCSRFLEDTREYLISKGALE